MKATLTIEVESETLTCVRCQRPTRMDAWELRKGDDPREPERWRMSGYRTPDGWHRLEWATPYAVGDIPAACPDCWPDIEIRTRAFVHGLAR